MPLGARKRTDEHLVKLYEQARDLRTDYTRDIAESRLFNRELLIRMEKTYADMGATLGLLGDQVHLLAEQVIGMREEIHELKDAVDAQTDAILKLVDRFDEFEGRPPGRAA
jgi:hypothetical protein